MKQGDIVFLKLRGHWTEHRFIRPYDFQDTCRIENGNGEMTCRLSELISKEEHDKLLAEKRREELLARPDYNELLEAWDEGLQTTGKIAEALHISTFSAGQKIACAKRWGLINDKPPTCKPV